VLRIGVWETADDSDWPNRVTDGLLPGSCILCVRCRAWSPSISTAYRQRLRGSARGRGSCKIATCKQTHCTDAFQWPNVVQYCDLLPMILFSLSSARFSGSLGSNQTRYRQWQKSSALRFVSFRFGVRIYSLFSPLFPPRLPVTMWCQRCLHAKTVGWGWSFTSKPENTSISGRPVVNSHGSGTGSAKIQLL